MILETYGVILQDMHDVANISTAFSVAIAVIKNGLLVNFLSSYIHKSTKGVIEAVMSSGNLLIQCMSLISI